MNSLNDQIAKYLKGELSPKEMHTLEKQALNDPFLADALEGAESISPVQFEKDVRDIEKETLRKKQNNIIWPLRIAASIILIITVTYVVIDISSTESENDSIALNKTSASQDEAAEVPAQPKEETIPQREEAQGETEQQKPIINAIPKIATREHAASQALKPIETKPATENEAAGATLSNENLIAEQVLTETSAEKEAFSVEDDTELRARDEISEARKEEAKADIAVNDTRSEGLKSKKLAQRAAEQPSAVSSREGDYQDYVKKNLVYPQSAVENKIEGQVIVSFRIGKDGTPFDFQVEKSLGFGCDEELIRVITNGPKWSPPVKETQRTSFSFTFTLPE